MRSITVNRDIPAPRPAVWAVLADFPNIARWNTGVTESHATSDAIEGVGATRHCDLSPMGALEESIAAWEPEGRLVISIDSTEKLPISSGRVTFTLGDDGGSTPTELQYEYEPKWAGVVKLIGPLIDRQLRNGFRGFLADLDAAAVAD